MHYHEHGHAEHRQSAQNGKVRHTLTSVHELHNTLAFQQPDHAHCRPGEHGACKTGYEVHHLGRVVLMICAVCCRYIACRYICCRFNRLPVQLTTSSIGCRLIGCRYKGCRFNRLPVQQAAGSTDCRFNGLPVQWAVHSTGCPFYRLPAKYVVR